VIGALSALLGACGEPTQYQDDGLIEVQSLTVQAQPATTALRYPAITDAADLTQLAFLIDGELRNIPVKAGSKVQRGQRLAQLDTHNLKLAVDDAQAKYQLSVSQYTRAKALFSQGAMPASQHDALKAQQEIAKAALELAKEQLSYADIKAPFDGVVARVTPKNYEKVSSGQPVLTLYRADQIELKVQISESTMARVRRDGSAHYAFNASFEQAPNLTFPASYKEHTTELDPKTGSYLVTLVLPMPKQIQLLQGMPAWVDIRVDQGLGDRSNPVIPTQALVSREGDAIADHHYYVWIIDTQQQVERVPVTLGEMRQNGVQITSGLHAGQHIVLAGQYQLEPGMTVTIVDGAHE
jgi:RND family efflux transporter MFP subunit